MKLPVTTYKKIDFRTHASSSQQNEFQEDIFEDIMSLYSELEELKSEINTSEDAVMLNNVFTYSYVRRLEDRVNNLERLIEGMRKGDKTKLAILHIEDISEDSMAPVEERLYIDVVNQVAHLPVMGYQISKLHEYDEMSEAISLPKDSEVSVSPSEYEGGTVEENKIENAIDSMNNTYWKRKVFFPLEDSREKLEAEVLIKIPDSSVFNRKVNMITINPFPSHSISIDTIEYKSNGNWRAIPGWGASNGSTRMKEIGKVKLVFPEISVTEIRVKLTQEQWYEDKGMKIFHFGISEIGVHHMDFRTSIGRFDARIDLEPGKSMKMITGIKPVFANEGTLTDRTELKASIFDYDIYIEKENGEFEYTKDRLPIMVEEGIVLIKGSIKKDGGNDGSPVLHSIELTYENV